MPLAPEPLCLPQPFLQANPQPPGSTLGVSAHWALGEEVRAESRNWRWGAFFWKVRHLIVSGGRYSAKGADHSHPQHPGPVDCDPPFPAPQCGLPWPQAESCTGHRGEVEEAEDEALPFRSSQPQQGAVTLPLEGSNGGHSKHAQTMAGGPLRSSALVSGWSSSVGVSD